MAITVVSTDAMRSSTGRQHRLTRSHATEPHLPPDQDVSLLTWATLFTCNERVWGSSPQDGSRSEALTGHRWGSFADPLARGDEPTGIGCIAA